MPATKPEDCTILFGKYVGKGDLDALLSLYDEEATFVRSDRSVHTGLPNIRKVLEPLAELKPQISMDIFRTVAIGDDLAVLYNNWTMKTADSGSGSSETTHQAIEIVRLQAGGSWRYIFDDPFAREK
ncbi:MAG: nuclear transport factor 2 family protein [Spirochaetales bacterium]|jgi:uncharacterized protein (TIGR02246 family)|nr:nuclear transport factor 2 family protein [Spirochaetales bacterium]